MRWLAEGVAAGQIGLRGGPVAVVTPAEPPRPAARAGRPPEGLPEWFSRLDTDRDGQLGLYEWRKSGRPLEEFFRMDRNGDGFVTAAELSRYLAAQPD